MAGYFSYFPNVFVGKGVQDDDNVEYQLVKNIFRRVRARKDLSQYTTLFEAYSVKPGETPAMIAHRLYDDPFLEWTIIIANEITDIYEEWPRSDNDLEVYIKAKYSNDDVNSTHHWETNEIKYNNIVYIKEGITVNETFRAVMPDGTTKSKEESIYEVTNYEHEYFLNEQKRQILIPIPTMIDIMIEEVEDLLAYEPHRELDRLNNKKTPISLASRFLNNLGSFNYSSNTVNNDTLTTTVTYDDGPTQTIAGVVGNIISSNTPSPSPSPAPAPSPSPSPTPSPY